MMDDGFVLHPVHPGYRLRKCLLYKLLKRLCLWLLALLYIRFWQLRSPCQGPLSLQSTTMKALRSMLEAAWWQLRQPGSLLQEPTK
jgi:hypothetical protein